jgi:hypothetical protein
MALNGVGWFLFSVLMVVYASCFGATLLARWFVKAVEH